MKKNKIFAENAESLQEKILVAKRELLNLRFQKASGELKDTSRFKLLKKNIARIMTSKNNKKK